MPNPTRENKKSVTIGLISAICVPFSKLLLTSKKSVIICLICAIRVPFQSHQQTTQHHNISSQDCHPVRDAIPVTPPTGHKNPVGMIYSPVFLLTLPHQPNPLPL